MRSTQHTETMHHQLFRLVTILWWQFIIQTDLWDLLKLNSLTVVISNS